MPRNKLRKFLYPLLEILSRLLKKNRKVLVGNAKAPEDFYQLSAVSNSGALIKFSDFKNKKVLIVNTATNCGYAPQFEALQKLHTDLSDVLVILAFPSNEFRNQESAADEQIAAICSQVYDVSFPIMKKGVVKEHSDQQEVFRWLTNKQKNGWNDNVPTWNFCKYLINENGQLTHVFEAAIEPTGKEIMNALSA